MDISAELGVLVRDIGDAGVAEMSTTPGLAAAVDQHVAEVRDRVGTDPDVLMSYLGDFASEAFDRGWWPQSSTEWEFVRIVAVCWLMRDPEEAPGGATP